MRLIGFVQIHNEVEKGNLRRCLNSLSKYCDEIAIYDDASTDNSVEVAREYTDLIIEGTTNEWGKEAVHRQELLELALTRNPDWIFWIDADEVIEKVGEEGGIRKLCESQDYDSWAFHETNLWRSPCFYRLDNAYSDGWYCRLWKNTGELFIENKPGLHQRLVPQGLINEGQSELEVLHYGFASDRSILNKYFTYKSHGQRGWALERLIDERTLRVAQSKQGWFNEKLPDSTPNDVYKIPLISKAAEYGSDS